MVPEVVSPLAQRLPCLLCARSSFFFGALSANFLNLLRNSCQFRAIAEETCNISVARVQQFSHLVAAKWASGDLEKSGAKNTLPAKLHEPNSFFRFRVRGKRRGVRASIAENRIDRHHVAVGRQAPAAVPGPAEGALKASEAAPEAPCRRGLPAPLVLRPERGRQEDAVSRRAQRGG